MIYVSCETPEQSTDYLYFKQRSGKDRNAICYLEECGKGFNFCWTSKANVEPKSAQRKIDFWGGTTHKRGILSGLSEKRPNRSHLLGALKTKMA